MECRGAGSESRLVSVEADGAAFCVCGGIMLKDMKTHTHLKPGQKGTKRLVEQYGDALLCVRYRYDEVRGVATVKSCI